MTERRPHHEEAQEEGQVISGGLANSWPLSLATLTATLIVGMAIGQAVGREGVEAMSLEDGDTARGEPGSDQNPGIGPEVHATECQRGASLAVAVLSQSLTGGLAGSPVRAPAALGDAPGTAVLSTQEVSSASQTIPTMPSPLASVEQPRMGVPLREVRTVQAFCSFYCPCDLCCSGSADGITATGRSAWKKGCAVSPQAIPYGSWVTVPGVGRLLADDTGIALKRSWRRGVVHVDIRCRSHSEAVRRGVRWTTVEVQEP